VQLVLAQHPDSRVIYLERANTCEFFRCFHSPAREKKPRTTFNSRLTVVFSTSAATSSSE
jgi:hypothetical protein